MSEQTRENWVQNRWRPALAWVYMAILLADFVLGPVLYVMFASMTGQELIPWVSLTSSAGGMVHVAMGAILGASAWTRGQEKIKRLETDNTVFETPPYQPEN